MTPISTPPDKGHGFFSGSQRSEHVLTAIVALLIAATAVWYGGSPPEIAAAISTIVWFVIAAGLALGLLPLRRLTRPSLIPLALLFGLTVFTGLSFFWSNNEGLAFDKLVQMTGVLGLFVIALFCSKPGCAIAWVRGIAFGLGALVLLAVFSRFFPGVGNDPQLVKSLYGSSGRLSWPLGYWNAMAAVTALGTILFVWLAGVTSEARWRYLYGAALPVFLLVLYLTSSRGALVALIAGTILLLIMEKRRKNIVIPYAFGILGGAVLVVAAARMPDLLHATIGGNAGTQGAILLALSIVVTGSLVGLLRAFESPLRARTVPRPKPWGWAVLGLIAVALVIAADPVGQVDSFVATPTIEPSKADQSSTDETNLTTSHLLSSAGNGRWQYWTVAVDAFREKPVAGIGAGGYDNFYTTNRDTLLFGRHAHSLPLSLLAELGLVGFLLGAAFLAMVILEGWKRWRFNSSLQQGDSPYNGDMIPILAALILTGMVSMTTDWTSEFPVIAATLLIAMAAIVGPATEREGARTESAEPSRTLVASLFPPEILPVLGVLAAGAALFISVYGFGISNQLAQSRKELGNGNREAAKKYARNAVDLAPWSAGALTQLAASQELAGEYVPALESIDRAIRQAPLDSTPLFAKFRVALALGASKEAVEALARAKKIDPYAPVFKLGNVSTPPTPGTADPTGSGS